MQGATHWKTTHSLENKASLVLVTNKQTKIWRLAQDGGVEGHALTPSFENTDITTNCRTNIDRKTLELTKKDTPHAKTKEKLQ